MTVLTSCGSGKRREADYEKLEGSRQEERNFLYCCLGFFILVVTSIMIVSGYYQSYRFLVISDDGYWYPPPPPHTQYADMARYVVHVSAWSAMATISTHDGIVGFPFANVFSISDGLKDNSSGVPYLYLTPMELSVKDLEKDPRMSLTMSLAQTDFCYSRDLDEQNPLCAHVILTGEVQKVPVGSEEEVMARKALFTRHPEMADWPAGHDWYVARVAVEHIYLLDYYGGAKVINTTEYFAAKPW